MDREFKSVEKVDSQTGIECFRRFSRENRDCLMRRIHQCRSRNKRGDLHLEGDLDYDR